MRSLSLDQLRALLEVVERGSFSAAARHLNLTQPAISLQIRELERRFDVQLIERLGKQAHATVPGAVIGGLHQWKTLRDGTAEQAVGEARDAIAQTDGTGLIVGPGCVLPMNTPDANVAAVVQALGGPLRKIPGVTA